jgi:tetratricopeptide (TPR) repeat protein
MGKKGLLLLLLLSIATISSNAQTDQIYNKALENIDDENYDEAIELLKSIEDTNDYLVFYWLGYCYYFNEDDTLAQHYLNRSIELNNEFSESYGYLGLSCFFSNKLEESERAFLRCIEIFNENYKDYFFLGKIYESRNDIKKAESYYLEALKYNGDDFYTNYALANIYFDGDDYHNAKTYFEICDKIDGQLYPVVSCLIRIKYRQEDFTGVEELKARLRLIKVNAEDARLKELSSFTIDVFSHKDFNVYVEEAFELSGSLYYHWTFIICDKNDEFIRSVNLESSAGLRSMGTNYIVGIDRYTNDRRVHQTTSIMFIDLPEYGVMKNIVIEEIEKGLNVGVMGIYPY